MLWEKEGGKVPSHRRSDAAVHVVTLQTPRSETRSGFVQRRRSGRNVDIASDVSQLYVVKACERQGVRLSGVGQACETLTLIQLFRR